MPHDRRCRLLCCCSSCSPRLTTCDGSMTRDSSRFRATSSACQTLSALTTQAGGRAGQMSLERQTSHGVTAAVSVRARADSSLEIRARALIDCVRRIVPVWSLQSCSGARETAADPRAMLARIAWLGVASMLLSARTRRSFQSQQAGSQDGAWPTCALCRGECSTGVQLLLPLHGPAMPLVQARPCLRLSRISRRHCTVARP